MDYKRRRIMGFSDVNPSAIVYPPLESTILLETGGDTGTNAGVSSSDLSANVNGVRRIIYNEPFFSHDFYTTTLQNSLVALFVSFYVNGNYNTGLFPICLPRQVLHHDMSEDHFESKRDFVKIQKSIAYALNLQFSKASHYLAKDSFSVTRWNPLAVNSPNFPLLQSAQLPPLLWEVSEATGQLILRRNEAFVPSFDPLNDFDFAFTLMSFRDVFLPLISKGPRSVVGPLSGWFSKGATVYGYGSLDHEAHSYVDDYYEENSSFFQNLMSQTLRDPQTASVEVWENTIVSPYRFTKHILMGNRTCAAIHGRYMTLNSRQLSRLQKRPCTSNTDVSFSQSLALYWNLIDYIGKYQDGENVVSNPPVLFYDRLNYSNSEADLSFIDEYNDILYTWKKDDLSAQSVSETLDFIPGATTIPAVYQALDPYFTTNGPRYDCLFPYEQINQNFITAPYTNNTPLNVNEVWAGKPSLSINHFLRVIGS